MPPTDASNGSTKRRRSRKSPTSNSRRASRPSTKKKNVNSPLFTVDPVAVEVDREHGLPQLLAGRGVDVHPDERRDRRREQDRRAAALGAQELAQRALESGAPARLSPTRSPRGWSPSVRHAEDLAAIDALGDQPAAGGGRGLGDL
jgi:hypothetical protein